MIADIVGLVFANRFGVNFLMERIIFFNPDILAYNSSSGSSVNQHMISFVLFGCMLGDTVSGLCHVSIHTVLLIPGRLDHNLTDVMW